jgi:UDP-2,3-diacylglucosamine pyrophosphatase LpxH
MTSSPPVKRLPALNPAHDKNLTWQQRIEALMEELQPSTPPPAPAPPVKKSPAPAPPSSTPSSSWSKVVVAGDFHLPFHHRQAVHNWIAFLRDTRPDVVILNGDILDCHAISSFSKAPNGPLLKDELELGRALLQQIRGAVGPSAELVYMEGNHEQRLQRRLLENPGLYGLPELHLKSLLRLDEVKASHLSYGEVWSKGALCVRHGDRVSAASASTARQELERGGFDHVIIGHVHRVGWFHKRGAIRHQQALENGGFFDRSQCEYEANPNWQNGFCVVMLEDGPQGRVHMQPVHVCEEDGSFWWGHQRWG